MSALRSHWLTVALFLGLLLVFVGERLLAPAGSHVAVSGAGVALVLASAGVRALRFFSAKAERRSIEGAFLALCLLAIAGVAVALFLSSSAREQELPTLAVVLRVLLPVLIATAVLPTLLGEVAYASMANAEQVERARVRDAQLSGLGLGFVLVFAFALYYVAAERDAKVDLSYFRTARPGSATLQIVRALDEPVSAITFFPPANDVGEAVHEYLSVLQKEAPQLTVERHDVAVDPAKARELGVSSNGAVILKRGNRKEQLLIGTEIERARSDLRNLDANVQRRLLAVTRTKRTVYLTTGHGERAQERGVEADQRARVRHLVELLEGLNHTVKSLSSAEGLASEIPADAAAVLVLGPQKPLLPEEAGALHRYLEKGGRLLVAVDPRPDLDLSPLLGPLGLRVLPPVLANDQAYLARTKQKSDRTTIATISYSSHPSVTTLSGLGRRAPLVLLDAAALEQLPDKPADVAVDVTVHSHAATWNDLNGNFEHDAPAEERKGWPLAVAVKRKLGQVEARAVVIGDSDAVADEAFGNDGNYYLALDAVKWLLGEEAYAGVVTKEEDVAIQHSRKENVFWFYSTVFVAPLAVLLIGWVTSRRRRRSGGVRATAGKGASR